MAAEGGYYNGRLSDYSDDFEDDEESSAVAKTKPKVPAVPVRPSPASVQKASPQTRRSDVGAGRVAKSTPRNTKSLPPRRRILASDKTRTLSHHPKAGGPKPYSKAYSQGVFSPRDRVISANQHALRGLQNKLSDAKRELEELRKENRLLNRLQARQERELNKIQTQEGELPQILARHTEEVRSLKDQLHRSQETARSHHHRASELHQELLKLSERKKKLEEVVRRKHLLEREALTVELQEKNDKLEEKNRRILELERTAEVVSRNHAQEVRQLRQRNKLLSLETDGLRHTSERMHTQLKEKERVMDVMNIYSQRMPRNVPLRTTAAKCQVENVTSQTDISCPPFKSVSLQSKPAMKARGSQTELDSPVRGRQPRSRLVAAETQTDSDTDVDSERKRVADDQLSSDVTARTRQSREHGQTQEHRLPEQVKPTVLVAETTAATESGGTDAEDGHLPQGKGVSLSQRTRESRLREDEERQKKEVLLARLRALDSQKDPPGSQPIAMPRSTAEQTATAAISHSTPTAQSTVTNSRPGEKPLEGGGRKPESKPSQTHGSKTESDSEAQRRKKLLLAKLMAIDEGNDPSKVAVKPSKEEVTRPPQKHDARTASTGGAAASANRSNTSLQSWPDTVDNMHRGKPAYSTEDDPLGKQFSRTSLTGPPPRKRSGSVKKEEGGLTFLTEGSPGEGTSERTRVGRRPRVGDIGGLLGAGVGPSAGPVDEKAAPTAQGNNDASHRPLLGRRTQPKPPQNAPIFGDVGLQGESRPKDTASRQESTLTGKDYPWEVRVQTNSNQAGLGTLGAAPRHASPSTRRDHSKRPLLPLRPKADQGFELMPGAIVSEPDDLEELVL